MSVATMKDVARVAGVSMATVSRVINGDLTVRTPVRRAVEAAIAELHYQPNLAARGLRKLQSGLFGLVLPVSEEPSLRIIRGVEAAVRERGNELLVAISDLSTSAELAHIGTFAQRGVDGIICYPVAERLAELRRLAHEIRPPIVVMGRYAADRELPTAVGDERSGMRAALADLHRKEHRRFGFAYSNRGGATISAARVQLIRELVEELPGCGIESVEIRAGEAPAALTGSGRPTALIINSPADVFATIAVLQDRGFHVPNDISLVLFSHHETAGDLRPPLATAGVDLAEYGRMAAGLLFEVIRDGQHFDGRSRLLSSTYVPRGSVGAVPASTEVVPPRP